MPAPTKFHFTSHSQARGRERKITEEEFRSTVISPDTKHQQSPGNNGGFVYRFEKEIDGSKLTVVAEVYKDECWFITGFWTK